MQHWLRINPINDQAGKILQIIINWLNAIYFFLRRIKGICVHAVQLIQNSRLSSENTHAHISFFPLLVFPRQPLLVFFTSSISLHHQFPPIPSLPIPHLHKINPLRQTRHRYLGIVRKPFI